MKKIIFIIAVIIIAAGGYFILRHLQPACSVTKIQLRASRAEVIPMMDEALGLLGERRDDEALAAFEKILLIDPENHDALWGKAEALRRNRDYKQTEEFLNAILKEDPQHAATLITKAYMKYNEGKFSEAIKFIQQALNAPIRTKENEALAYVIWGGINGRRAQKGGPFAKVIYGMQVKGYFVRAYQLAPDLPEVHLGLGTFYMLAPGIAGGNLNKAEEELKIALKMAPDFATVSARLAQLYKKKGDMEKHNSYFERAKKLDPENEVFREMRDE